MRLAVLAGMTLTALHAAAGDLRVMVSNVTGATGSVIVLVYDRAERWLGDEVYLRAGRDVGTARQGDTVTFQLSLPPGDYALSVFHDIDGDGRMARSFFGLPQEPAGLSNNARPRFGPPRWRDARFELRELPVVQRIRLN